MSSHNNPINLDLADRDWRLDELYVDWRVASAAADAAYAAWKAWPDRDRYAAYIAATDQADVAAEHLAAVCQMGGAADRWSPRRPLFRPGMSHLTNSETEGSI